eukprot:scaffold3357_cov77-Isochrysis_galbana.AAC.2
MQRGRHRQKPLGHALPPRYLAQHTAQTADARGARSGLAAPVSRALLPPDAGVQQPVTDSHRNIPPHTPPPPPSPPPAPPPPPLPPPTPPAPPPSSPPWPGAHPPRAAPTSTLNRSSACSMTRAATAAPPCLASPHSARRARCSVCVFSAHASAAVMRASKSSTDGKAASGGRRRGSAARRTAIESECSRVRSDETGRREAGSACSMLTATRRSDAALRRAAGWGPGAGRPPPAVSAAARAAASMPLNLVRRSARGMAAAGSRALRSSHATVRRITSVDSCSTNTPVTGRAGGQSNWGMVLEAAFGAAWEEGSGGAESGHATSQWSHPRACSPPSGVSTRTMASPVSPSGTPAMDCRTARAVVVKCPSPTPHPNSSSAAAAAPRSAALLLSSSRASTGSAICSRRPPTAKIATAATRSVVRPSPAPEAGPRLFWAARLFWGPRPFWDHGLF